MTLQGLQQRMKGMTPKWMLLLVEMLQYWMRLCKYNASFSTDDDMQKMQYTLLRENHVIEKGMSMRCTKKGFGQEKVKALIARLEKYNRLYGKQDAEFLIYPLSTIKSYIEYQKKDNVDISDIEMEFCALCSAASIEIARLSMPAGIVTVNSGNLRTNAAADFRSLLYSRHSIRYFTDSIPSRSTIDMALELAQRTPSACNRQAWHTHVYTGEDCHQLLLMQGGCMGFYNDIHCCIVVTADMKGFLHYEPFQCFVDGGLYAQNLINALHYLGLGTIPLSFGFYRDKLKKIQGRFSIPDNEALIVVIGVGEMTDKVKIAESTRKSVKVTNTFH